MAGGGTFHSSMFRSLDNDPCRKPSAPVLAVGLGAALGVLVVAARPQRSDATEHWTVAARSRALAPAVGHLSPIRPQRPGPATTPATTPAPFPTGPRSLSARHAERPVALWAAGLAVLGAALRFAFAQPGRKPPTPIWMVAAAASPPGVPAGSVTAVLLSGGVGKRMGAAIPKQYLELRGQPIATYSLAMFASMPEVGELVVVCNEEWRHLFDAAYATLPKPHRKPLRYALPGKERQDSVYNGLQAVRPGAALVAVHDTARPLVTARDALRCFQDAMVAGAAVLGVPVKPTIKEVGKDGMVIRTLDRSVLWEVQTPQCIRPGLLQQGFDLVRRNGLEVTDDVSIIEAMGLPVRITPGVYSNLKVTTPDDLQMAERFLELGTEAL